MSRLQTIDPQTATGKTKDLLDGIQQRLGMTPNLTRIFANSPAVLEAYLNFSGALSGGALSPKLREQIALAVSEQNNCNYCLAAHNALGKMAGLSDEQRNDSRRGIGTDAKSQAAISFASSLVEKQGWVSDEEIEAIRSAGYGDGEITEIIANVALTLFTNYFNHVAETEVDFPKVEALTTA